MKLLASQQEIELFQSYIRRWFMRHGRTHLPWRENYSPYHVLVSELMLQQTQVERVIPKYLSFLESFPKVQDLAKAQLSEVLTNWQGLGYNRRAKYLHLCAKKVSKSFQGVFPEDEKTLLDLPGIGPYTASALSAFAFNQSTIMIETNIRTVFLYHFFPAQDQVSDSEVISLIQQTLPTENYREWYSALMDYGTALKKLVPNPSRKSKHHSTQSKFKGSPRQVRGEIIRLLTKHNSIPESQLKDMITTNSLHYPKVLEKLVAEQMIVREGDNIKLGT